MICWILLDLFLFQFVRTMRLVLPLQTNQQRRLPYGV